MCNGTIAQNHNYNYKTVQSYVVTLIRIIRKTFAWCQRVIIRSQNYNIVDRRQGDVETR